MTMQQYRQAFEFAAQKAKASNGHATVLGRDLNRIAAIYLHIAVEDLNMCVSDYAEPETLRRPHAEKPTLFERLKKPNGEYVKGKYIVL